MIQDIHSSESTLIGQEGIHLILLLNQKGLVHQFKSQYPKANGPVHEVEEKNKMDPSLSDDWRAHLRHRWSMLVEINSLKAQMQLPAIFKTWYGNISGFSPRFLYSFPSLRVHIGLLCLNCVSYTYIMLHYLALCTFSQSNHTFEIHLKWIFCLSSLAMEITSVVSDLF